MFSHDSAVNRRASHIHRLVTALKCGALAGSAALLSQCAGSPGPGKHADVVVSVKDQKLAVYNKEGKVTKTYPVSTSKFGVNDKPGKFGTPLGTHEVVAKIGHGAPPGAVFKSRHWTGEVIKPDSPGRDPIVSRILWLRGLEKQNQNAYARCIYIHGTAEEVNIGKPVSYGCVRMKSKDVIDLFGRLPIGSRVTVVTTGLPKHVPTLPTAVPVSTPAGERPPIFLTPPKQAEEDGPLFAENTRTPAATSTEHASPTRAPAPTKRRAATVSTDTPKETAAAASQKRVQQFQSGEKVLYSAPGATVNGPGVILRSKRSASQNLN
jgi:lipoprotein-anchoring transpeptidase ErfK/SrfK